MSKNLIGLSARKCLKTNLFKEIVRVSLNTQSNRDSIPKPGYKIPQMFSLSLKGDLRGMWIMGKDLLQLTRIHVKLLLNHFPETSINYNISNTGDEFTLTPEYKVKALRVYLESPYCNIKSMKS
jgi:hypothetical protein